MAGRKSPKSKSKRQASGSLKKTATAPPDEHAGVQVEEPVPAASVAEEVPKESGADSEDPHPLVFPGGFSSPPDAPVEKPEAVPGLTPDTDAGNDVFPGGAPWLAFPAEGSPFPGGHNLWLQAGTGEESGELFPGGHNRAPVEPASDTMIEPQPQETTEPITLPEQGSVVAKPAGQKRKATGAKKDTGRKRK